MKFFIDTANLDQIKEIHEATDAELEFFVSGALCVSFSGNCYMSVANGERSANRGSCAQNCRLPYELIDGNGRLLMQSAHLLSIKDLDLSDHLPELIEAGICSFKIEGRLKDIVYVKNNVSYLRKRLDTFLSAHSDTYQKASSGRTFYNFEPQLDRSFNRGYTDYFVHNRTQKIGSWDTPKSQGQPIGKIIGQKANGYIIENHELLNNGDGLYFINTNGDADGAQVNIVVNDVVVFNAAKEINPGTMIYRNSDAEFNKMVEQEKSAIRKIGISMVFREADYGFILTVIDEDGYTIEEALVADKIQAKSEESVLSNIIKNLAKTGNTVFTADDIQVDIQANWFLPTSQINELRRKALDALTALRIKSYV